MAYEPVQLRKDYNLTVTAPEGNANTVIVHGLKSGHWHKIEDMREFLAELAQLGKRNAVIDLSIFYGGDKKIRLAYLDEVAKRAGFNVRYTGISDVDAAAGFNSHEVVFQGRIEPTIEDAVKKLTQ
ncbi:MAG: hypothetical protein QS98_C0003G0062 [archaeon GW2011_AR3]|nr:MAG: hypothetical protein QS98_C0003G0062 [archaeon GW2011_AR3]MBS3110104.1 hypothetical protein [Candidatus Woesearchaeota archaeon]